MKKTYLLIVMLFLTVSICRAQDTVGLKVPIKDGKVIYEGVIDIPNKTKIDLYTNSKQWFVDYFKSSKDVIQNDDKELGRIVGKGIILIPYKTILGTGTYNDKISIQIDCKDGKYRYRIYDMILNSIVTSLDGSNPTIYEFTPEDLISKLNGQGKSMFSKKQCQKLLDSIDEQTKSTIESLKKAIGSTGDNF